MGETPTWLLSSHLAPLLNIWESGRWPVYWSLLHTNRRQTQVTVLIDRERMSLCPDSLLPAIRMMTRCVKADWLLMIWTKLTNIPSKKSIKWKSSSTHLPHSSRHTEHLYKEWSRVKRTKFLIMQHKFQSKDNDFFILSLICCVNPGISLGLSVPNPTSLKMELIGLRPPGFHTGHDSTWNFVPWSYL